MGKEGHRSKGLFLSGHFKDMYSHHDLSLFNLDQLAEAVLIRFLHCTVTLFSPFSTVPFGRKSAHAGLLRSGELCSPSLTLQGLSISINYLKFFCMGDLFLFPYLFIQPTISLYQDGLMDAYFILMI